MNILFLCDEYPPCEHGGIGTVTRILARELVKKGHKAVVCGFYPYYRKAKPFEIDNGVTVYRIFYGSYFKLKFSKRSNLGRVINIKNEFNSYLSFLKNIILEHNIDLIEMPDYYEAFRYAGPKFIKFPDFGIPKVVKIHGGDTFFNYIKNNAFVKDLQYIKEEQLISDATLLLAISEFSRQVIKSIFDYKNDIPVIYNGIEANNNKYIYKTRENIVVFSGTITEKKGIFSLIRAWGNVIKEIPDATLSIYGKGSKKSLKMFHELLPEVARNSVFLKGFVGKEILQEAYSAASCAVFPSYAESFGMAPIEAMQVECPTIFTRKASGPELISDGEEGLLVDPDNISEISDAIIFLLKNREKAIEIGRKGAFKVKSHFDISVIADQHIEIYKKIINS